MKATTSDIKKALACRKTCKIEFANGSSTKAKIGSAGIKLSYGQVLSFDTLASGEYTILLGKKIIE